MTISEQIKVLCVRSNISVAELARRMGTTPQNLIRYMDKLPEKYVEDFDASYQKASNRLVREFTQQFCFDDGSIDWEKLVEFNSGN